MTFPITRQGLEQLALVFALGALVFLAIAVWRAYRRRDEWRRPLVATGALGVLVAACLALAYTIAPNIPTPSVPFTARFQQNPVPDTPEAVAAGRERYLASCAICHGPQGRGDGPQAFLLNPRPVDLQLHVPTHAPGEVFYWISEGIQGTAMPAWKDTIDETDRWRIVHFLYDLAGR